jgi:origin recognition complex subunit 5
MHFQDETLLDPGVVAITPIPTTQPITTTTTTTQQQKQTPKQQQPPSAGSDLASLLPTTPRLLLLACYLASHNATRHDLVLFSTHHHGRRRRGGRGLSVGGSGRGAAPGRSKHRKIARKLLGAHAFVLERMLAIFAAVRGEWEAARDSTSNTDVAAGEEGGADIGMAIATLASLRLLVRVGGGVGDVMDCGGKWRVNVGWEVIRGLGRSVRVEVEEWLMEGEGKGERRWLGGEDGRQVWILSICGLVGKTLPGSKRERYM